MVREIACGHGPGTTFVESLFLLHKSAQQVSYILPRAAKR